MKKACAPQAHAIPAAEEDHLLPFYLAERVVLDDDNLDVELILHAGHDLAHKHGQAAIAQTAGRDKPRPWRWHRAGRCRRKTAGCHEYRGAWLSKL